MKGIAMGPKRVEPDQKTYSGRCATRLRWLREKSGLTVEEVAKIMGVNRSSVYHWETGHAFPKVDQLPLLAKTLNQKSPRYLFAEK
jgi:transcriptional regulator with XRE-family HTH domain